MSRALATFASAALVASLAATACQTLDTAGTLDEGLDAGAATDATAPGIVDATTSGLGDATTPDPGDGGATDGADGDASADDGGDAGDGACGPNLTGILRDFRRGDRDGGHPDFETYLGDVRGMVLPNLGADGKPVYAGTDANPVASTHGKTLYDQWYRDTPGVNQRTELRLTLTDNGDGTSSYSNQAFFPVDGQLWGNEGLDHNFHFTFELHTQFTYLGGERFTFTGDDDQWTFLNGKLAIDLGGVHTAESQPIALDDLAAAFGLEKGKTYPLDVFQAERHTSGSTFRIDTSIGFTNCAPIVR